MGKQQIGALTGRMLARPYWYGAAEDLVTLEYVERMQRHKGCMQRYRVVKPLPSSEDLDTEIRDHYTRSIIEWLDAADEELNELKEEMGEWRGNMQGTGFESTDKYQEVEEAEDNLNFAVGLLAEIRGRMNAKPNLKDRRVPVDPSVLVTSCSYRQKKKRSGRHWRAQEVCNILHAIERAVRAKKTPDKQVTEFADLIHGVAKELDDVEFPSAY